MLYSVRAVLSRKKTAETRYLYEEARWCELGSCSSNFGWVFMP
jgi:hypothetical protein